MAAVLETPFRERSEEQQREISRWYEVVDWWALLQRAGVGISWE